MSISYAWEKFYEAVSALASLDKPLRERLYSVLVNDLAHVQPERDLPENLRKRYKNIKDQATIYGGFRESIDEMNEIQLHAIVDEIAGLFNDIVVEKTTLGINAMRDYEE